MWKIFFRGLRESFGRCGERAAVGTACEGNNGFTANSKPGKDSGFGPSQGSDASGGHQWEGQQGPAFRVTSQASQCKSAFFKGVGLSTVVWLTQFARDCHHWRRHERPDAIFSPDKPEQHRCRYKCLLHILAGVARAQPKRHQSIEYGQADSDSLGSLETDFSSIASEDSLVVVHRKELDDARNGLGEIGSNIENLLGVYYFDHSKHEHALDNFKKAWARGNVKACYNLGLCHELGVGTQPDPEKAAEYYKKAAGLGHVQASYNLGVYYAQGRGGLPKDPAMAHQLFSRAANQGLLQAKVAISTLDCPEPPRLEVHKPPSLQQLAVGM